MSVEVNDEYLVVGVTCGNKSHGGCHDIRAPLCHAAAVVDDKTYRGWCVFRLENFDRLRAPVFQDTKIIGGEAAGRIAVVVEDRHVENGQVNVDGYGELEKQRKREKKFHEKQISMKQQSGEDS